MLKPGEKEIETNIIAEILEKTSARATVIAAEIEMTEDMPVALTEIAFWMIATPKAAVFLHRTVLMVTGLLTQVLLWAWGQGTALHHQLTTAIMEGNQIKGEGPGQGHSQAVPCRHYVMTTTAHRLNAEMIVVAVDDRSY